MYNFLLGRCDQNIPGERVSMKKFCGNNVTEKYIERKQAAFLYGWGKRKMHILMRSGRNFLLFEVEGKLDKDGRSQGNTGGIYLNREDTGGGCS
jgi:hypothetical protein